MQIELEVEGSVYDLKESLENAICDFLEENAYRTKADNAGLDRRCGRIWITRNFIIAQKGVSGNIDYYGGFEYVGDDERFTMGDYTFYSAESSRVTTAIDYYYENNKDEMDDQDGDE